MNTDGTGYTVLKSFTNNDGPNAGLILSGGTLYGTTYMGGSSGDGTVFKMNTNGTGVIGRIKMYRLRSNQSVPPSWVEVYGFKRWFASASCVGT
jgi:uncharacterized repeat protein (TIGR03803 family)